jgi:hypothetical protein
MKRRLVFLICAFFLLTGSGEANVSRIHQDGVFSGSVVSSPAQDGLVLGAEDLEVSFPVLEADMPSLKKMAAVAVTYRVINRTSVPVRANLQFLGLRITEGRISLNGGQVQTAAVGNEVAGSEFLERITRHRYQWEPKIYEWYFHTLRKIGGWADSAQPDLEGLLKAARKSGSLKQVFPQVDKLSALAFSVIFKPGENILQIRYEQGLFLEGHTAYMGGPVVRAGFDYLLYPARTWTLDPAFTLNVTVRLPDLVRKGWLWDSRQTLPFRTNLVFSPSYDPATKTTVLAGRFRTIPADVFSLHIVKE